MTCNFGVIYSLLRVLVSRREKRKREPLREFRLHNRSVNLIVAPKRPEETKQKEKKNEARQWLVNELLSGQDNKSTYSYPFFIHLSLSLSPGRE